MHTTHKYYNQTILASSILMASLISGCNNDDNDNAATVPVINASNPINLAIDVAINQQITATFSEAMNEQTINDAS
ncbi:Ig-like domain-containing protein, partial [Shewanella sp. SR41-2]|nr:Ig-like domain-containing protein [Shewanella sp. SR41-2]